MTCLTEIRQRMPGASSMPAGCRSPAWRYRSTLPAVASNPVAGVRIEARAGTVRRYPALPVRCTDRSREGVSGHCGCSSVGRAFASQAKCRRFDPDHPLHSRSRSDDESSIPSNRSRCTSCARHAHVMRTTPCRRPADTCPGSTWYRHDDTRPVAPASRGFGRSRPTPAGTPPGTRRHQASGGRFATFTFEPPVSPSLRRSGPSDVSSSRSPK